MFEYSSIRGLERKPAIRARRSFESIESKAVSSEGYVLPAEGDGGERNDARLGC